VLHPELTPDGVGLPGDDRPGAGHWVATTPELGLIGVVSVMPEAVPWDPQTGEAWRLRGMATAPEARGWGVGADLVARVLEHARAQKGRILWCTARMGAVGFYQRQGFTTWGETWDEPVIGTHIHMLRPL